MTTGRQLRIEGRVQGVGYRASFAAQAKQLGLRGWVRNCSDGSVEACIDGEAAALDTMIAWARRGPPTAQVSHLTVEPVGEGESCAGPFQILPTR